MVVYVIRRLVIFALTLLAASLLVFLVLSILPGDPAQAMLGTQATPAALKELRHQLGLDRSFWVRYWDWLSGLLHGDFGRSAISQQPIAPQITGRLAVSGPLVLMSLLIALLVAIPTGILAALRHRRPS